jgi:two-component system CheB/CheR fusion protein
MGELLRPRTPLKIIEIEDGLHPEANCVYINPPNRLVAIFDHTLHLLEPEKSQHVSMPIDFFLQQLADDLKEKAIAVILSGTGTDGTIGLKAVKGAGGIAMVQQQDQAAYGGMPTSAIGTGLVDLVLPVEKMGPELLHYLHHPYIAAKDKPTPDDTADAIIKKILFLIRASTGNDFSGYKPNTIHRRIERRMALQQIGRLEDYLRFIQQTPAEVHTLFKDLLIGVTSFFRDPQAFAVVAENAFLPLLKHKAPEMPIRIWVPGCATGEEAYSLAMLLVELMDELNQHHAVQIFATDIDEDAIHAARQGIYPDSIAADVSKQRLQRFFIRNGKTYTIQKKIREMVVFAVQNLINDPPFSKLDLVSCRNLLIYMGKALQKHIIPLFHFTLRAGGMLFLGSSESIGRFSDLFTPIHSKHKLFIRKEVLLEKMVEYPLPPLMDAVGPAQTTRSQKMLDARSVAEKMIFRDYAPDSVLINEQYEILYFLGDTSAYLRQSVGEPSINLLKLIHGELRHQLSAALAKAVREKKKITMEDLAFHQQGRATTLKIVVTPLNDPAIPAGMMLVVFEEQRASVHSAIETPTPDDEENIDPRIKSLEEELRYTRENLQTTIEQLETSNEELKSTNEELQSTNEELKSTNEELETSKEEMHATNEELVTINDELQSKLKELERAKDDINNLMASTEIATLFLDCDLRIKRYTPKTAKLFNLIESDTGRPIGDITSKIEYRHLSDDARKVLSTLIPLEKELTSSGGEWFAMRMMPYRTSANLIDGVVVTFSDITRIRRSENLQRLAAVVQDANDAITVQDFDGKILAWNQAAEKVYGWRETEILNESVFKLVPEDRHAEVRTLMAKLKKGNPVRSFETRRITKDGQTVAIYMTITVLVDDAGRPTRFATTEKKI